MTKEERSLLQETHDASVETRAVLLTKGGVLDRLKAIEQNQHRFVTYKVFGFFFGGGMLLIAGISLGGRALRWW